MLFSNTSTTSYTPLNPNRPTPPKSSQAPSIVATELWRPLWMRRWILILFTLLFIAVIAALEVLSVTSNQHDGLASTSTSYHYFWTYGPTASFTLFLALWNRVDYRIRQMMPWIALHEHPGIAASQSIFLDYLSPTMPEILWQSFKNRHFAVTSSTLVVNLITVMMIVSTSLFSLEPRPLTINDVAYRTTAAFARNGPLQPTTLPSYMIDGMDYWNLTYPFGVTPEYAFQPFELADNRTSSNALQQANVEVMLPGLDCEEARLDFVSWSFSWMWTDCNYNISTMNSSMDTVTGNNATMNLTSSDCTIKTWYSASPIIAYTAGVDGDVGNFASFAQMDCAGKISDSRIVLVFGEAVQHGDIGPYPPSQKCLDEAPIADIEILRSKQWICKPSLKLTLGNVTFNSTDISRGILPRITLDEAKKPHDLPNMTDFDLTWGVVGTSQAPFSSDNQSIALKADPAETYAEMRVLRSVNPDRREELLTTDLYRDLAIAHYKRELSIIGHWLLARQDTNLVEGVVVINQNRLLVRGVPLRILEVLSGIIALLVLSLIVILPRTSVAPCDPARLSNLLVILKQSPSMVQSFSQTGSLGLKALKRLYESREYSTMFMQENSGSESLSGKNSFVLKDVSDSSTVAKSADSDQILWWRPYTIVVWSRIAASVIVASLILTLIALVTFSNRTQGLATVALSGYQSVTWTIFPAVIMSGVAMYFRALNSIYKVFGPFSLLRKGVSTPRILSRNYQSMTEVEILLHATRDRNGGVFFTTFAAILTAFLTIAVSGVFTALPAPTTSDATIAPQSWFEDTGSNDDGTAGSNGIISGLVLRSNLSYPQWTYEDLALASFDPAESSPSGSDTTFRSIVPAVRADLECTLYDQENIDTLQYIASATSVMSPGLLGSTLGDSKDCRIETYLQKFNGVKGNFTFFSFLNNTKAGCPFLNFFWGYQAPTNGSWATYNVTYGKGLACFETTSQLDVDVTFTYPDLRIDTRSPPVSLKSTSKPFSSAINKIPYGSMPSDTIGTNYGYRFRFAMQGYFGITDEDLLNPDNDDRIVEAIKYTHRVIRAQQYHATLRSSSVASQLQPVAGVLTDLSTYRLFLNDVATIVLCSLLGGILICLAMAAWLMNTKHVLPKNPLTIGAAVSLLVDSNLLRHEESTDRNGTIATSDIPKFTTYEMGWVQSKYAGKAVWTIHGSGDEHGRANNADDSGVALQTLLPTKQAQTAEHEDDGVDSHMIVNTQRR